MGSPPTGQRAARVLNAWFCCRRIEPFLHSLAMMQTEQYCLAPALTRLRMCSQFDSTCCPMHGAQSKSEMEALMRFWGRHLSRRPTPGAGGLPAGATEGLVEVRPGEVTLERVGGAKEGGT